MNQMHRDHNYAVSLMCSTEIRPTRTNLRVSLTVSWRYSLSMQICILCTITHGHELNQSIRLAELG